MIFFFFETLFAVRCEFVVLYIFLYIIRLFSLQLSEISTRVFYICGIVPIKGKGKVQVK